MSCSTYIGRRCKRHLLSDVPVGILLSGGLDSGLLLALMNEHGGAWPAYTIGYGTSYGDDELADAAETAAILGARHIPVTLDQAEFERSLPKIVGCLEEPDCLFLHRSDVFRLSARAAGCQSCSHRSGAGRIIRRLQAAPRRSLRRIMARTASGLRSLVGSAVNGLPRNETLKRGVRSLASEDRLTRYQDVFSLASAETIDGLFRADVLPERQGHELVEYWDALRPQMEQTDELGGFQLLEIRSSLPDELLMYADKLSMAHSLEARVPYLDRTVVEYVQRLDASFKIRHGTRKWLHRQVCRTYLPPRILKRKKRGFAVNVVDGGLTPAQMGKSRSCCWMKTPLMFDLLRPDQVTKASQRPPITAPRQPQALV